MAAVVVLRGCNSHFAKTCLHTGIGITTAIGYRALCTLSVLPVKWSSMNSKDGRRDNMEKPLRGAVLCCTSIQPEQRTHMAEAAVQMGAEHRFDLTSDVTHLIVGDSNTPKYKYVAREREDIKAVQLEWVEAVRHAWMRGDDVDLEAMETEYRLPTFAGLRICVTGFEDLSFRAQLQKHISENGGEYRGDLTKEVTHLIAFNAEGKKYQFATQWGIKVVGLEWLKDSLIRRMILDESLYHPSTTPDQQGVGAWKQQVQDELQLGKRSRSEDVEPDLPRKLRRTASAKLGSQSESLWGEIVSGPQHNELEKLGSRRTSGSLSAVRPGVLEPKSFATDTTGIDDELRRPPPPPSREGIFSGLSFLLHAFNSRQASILREHLLSNHGESVEIMTDPGRISASFSVPTFLIVPYDRASVDLLSTEHCNKDLELVTDLWAERCLLSKRFFHPDEHVLSRPIRVFPIPGLEKLTINTTGFADVDLLHVCKVIKLSGATFDQVLKPGISLLLGNKKMAGEEKLRHAWEWRIPSVSIDWLWSCIQSGEFQSFRPFLLQRGREQQVLQDPIPQSRHAISGKKTGATTVPDHGHITQGGQDPARVTKGITPRASSATGAVTRISNLVRGEGFLESPSSKHRDCIPSDEAIIDEKGSQLPVNGHGWQERAHQGGQEAVIGHPLEEISINPAAIPRDPSSHKACLSGHLDGQASLPEGQQTDCPSYASDTISAAHTSHFPAQSGAITGAIKELLNKNKMSKTTSAVADDKRRKRRLLGTALSNLSNSSREGSTVRASRASSIDSVNTDGLGSVILDDTSQAKGPNSANSARRGSFTGRASAQNRQAQQRSFELCDAALYREEYAEDEAPPQMTQLGYENPDDAVALREMLAERRRTRTGRTREDCKAPESREEKKIKDDAATTPAGRGPGRRSRQRAKSP